MVVTDDAGNQTLFTPAPVTTLDISAPIVAIAAPSATGAFTTAASSITLGGTATDDIAVSAVTWANAATATSGTATGTASWSIASVALVAGANSISVTATDAAGNFSADTIVVTRDNTGPTVDITVPTSAATHTTASATLAVSGTASDPAGIASVTWANTTNATSGTATGTTSWSVAAVSLALGSNTINVVATDGVGNEGTSLLTLSGNEYGGNLSINNDLGFHRIAMGVYQESAAIFLNHTGTKGVHLIAGEKGGAVSAFDRDGELAATLPESWDDEED